MNTELVVVDPKQFGLEQSKANEIKKGLEITLAEREILKRQYEDVINLEITPESIKLFKNLRMQIRDNRTKGIMVWHKENKEFYLRGGQFVDAIKNKEILINEQMEEKLENAEKFFENQEKEKIAQLQKDRVELLRPYDVENLDQLQLGSMDLSIFESFLLGCKTTFETKKEREAKAEAERVAKEKQEAEEREAQRIENERLKKEAEEREAAIKKEREEAEEKARKDKEESDRILAEEKAKQQAELDRIAKEKEEQEAIFNTRSKELQPYVVFIRDYNGLLKADEAEYQKVFADIKAGAEQHWEFERKEQIRKQEEADKKEAENRALLEAERKEKDRIAKELQDKKDAEEKAAKEKKDAEEKAKKDAEALAMMSLKKQRQAWIDRFAMPETELSDVKTKEIQARFAGFITWATQTNNQ